MKVDVAFKDLKKVKVDETSQSCRDIEQGRLCERGDLQRRTEQIDKQQKIKKKKQPKNIHSCAKTWGMEGWTEE